MWIGAGLALKPITNLAKALHLTTFNLSFIVLGIATSMGEFGVGVNALVARDPEIFVGNLLGANLILFLLVIPCLAIFGNRLQIDRELRGSNLPLVLGNVALPALLSFDGKITPQDGGVAVVSYLLVAFFVTTRKGILAKIQSLVAPKSAFIWQSILMSLLGVLVIFIGSNLVVRQTEYFSTALSISPFLLSLLVIGLGTNLPEIAVGVRALFSGASTVAFADYVGSAAFNTFLFGLFSLLFGTTITLHNAYWLPLTTTFLGLILVFLFAKSRHTISRREATVLLLIYIGFLTAEVLK
jgi:cation:H+ antiporter